jgi:putative addiction module component (TIGR02574 family)
MSEATEKLKPQLARLTDDERADLASFLLSSISDGDGESSDLTQLLDRRSHEMRSGQVAGVPAEEVLESLRTQYP